MLIMVLGTVNNISLDNDIDGDLNGCGDNNNVCFSLFFKCYC